MIFNTQAIPQQQEEVNASLNQFAHMLIQAATGTLPQHKHYRRAVEMQKTYRALLNISEAEIDVLPLSGPQKELLKKFNRERTDAEFEAAIARIVSTTKGMLESVINIFQDTIESVKPTPNTIKYSSQTDNAAADDLKKKLTDYFGNKTPQQYCYQTYPQKAAHSFNNWHVTEIESTPQGNRPYPVEIECKDAINWGYRNNRLQFLLARKPGAVKSEMDSFIIWVPFYTMELTAVSNTETAMPNLVQHNDAYDYTEQLLMMARLASGEPQTITDQDVTYFIAPNEAQVQENSALYITTPHKTKADRNQYWRLKIYPHLAPVVPATRYGYVDDLFANGSIKTSYLQAGIEAVLKAMQDNKVLEESKQNNAYPREAHYVRECEDCNGTGSIETPNPRNATVLEKCACSACGGTGKLRPRTATDVIEVPYPPQDIIMKAGGLPPLGNLSATFPSDMTTIEYLTKELARHEETLHRRIFRSLHFMTEKSYSTATEVEFDSKATYGAIYKCAKHMAESIVFHTYLCAFYLNAYDGLVIDFGIPPDMRNLSEVQVAELIKKYTESGIPQNLRTDLLLRLIDMTYPNDYEQSLKSRLIAEHDPFFGLSETEKQIRLNSAFVPDEDKALSQNIIRFFADYPELLKMTERKTREEFLRSKANALITQMQAKQKAQMEAMRQNQADLTNLFSIPD